jgi:hypothetical protein
MSKLVAVAAVSFVGFVLLHCGKTLDDPADAGRFSDAAPSTPPYADAGAADASIDSSDSALDATAPPKVSCADDASACDALPPSVCADSKTLVYYGGGACVDGSCTWTQSTMTCGVQSYCVQGGCTPPTTK